jgi:DNA modification methylase
MQNRSLPPLPIYEQTRFSLREIHDIFDPGTSLNIEEKLQQLLKQDLTFNGKKTAYATHNMHAFAAKFPPQLPQLFIKHLTRPGETVLDPMVGS